MLSCAGDAQIESESACRSDANAGVQPSDAEHEDKASASAPASAPSSCNAEATHQKRNCSQPSVGGVAFAAVSTPSGKLLALRIGIDSVRLIPLRI